MTNGARYSAWLYADNSPYGAAHALILFKWTDWNTFTSLGSVPLLPLGTGPHVLKLTFEADHISAYVDGALQISTNDNSFASGGVDVETYEDPTHFSMLTDYLLVTTADNGLAITSMSVLNKLATVTWNSAVGSVYRLQCKNSPDDPIWTDVTPDVTATSSTASQTNGVSGLTRRIYHVLLVSP